MNTTTTSPSRETISTQQLSVDAPEDVDYMLYTDGSGYTDHFGGYGAIALSAKHSAHCYIQSCGCATHTETGRAEFLAVLSGLHSILEENGWETESVLDSRFQGDRLKVHIVSDRADLVGSINGYYRRKSNPDLWQQLAWYERYIDLTAEHVKRETHNVQSIADKTASLMRLVIKDFVEAQNEFNQM